MNFKKNISLILLLVVLFCLSKNFFMSYAAENSGYAVLLNNENAAISFAGMRYAVDSDLKNASIEFQITDTHLFKGKQGVILTVICGNRKDTVHIDSNSETDIDASFFSLDNLFTEINSFDSHTNVKIDFEITFNEKLKDKLVFKMLFTDAVGVQSEEAYYVLYSPEATTETTTKSKESTTHKLTESSSNSRQTSGTSSFNSTEHHHKYPNSGDNYYNDVKDSIFLSSQQSSGIFSDNLNDTSMADIFSNKNYIFGLRQIVALTLAAFLIIAAAACIIIGIKRNKVT